MATRRIVRKGAKSKKYKCAKCDKTFSDNRYRENHNEKYPECDKKYECEKCYKTFERKDFLQRHMDRKTPCVPEKIPVITKGNPDHVCKDCGKDFASAYSLKRHMQSCDSDTNRSYILRILQELEELKANGSNRSTTVNNITNNNLTLQQNNVNLNVIVCGFGNEDLSRLDISKIKQLIMDKAQEFIPRMIEEIHVNPQIPEHHNIYYDVPKAQLMVFKQNGELSTWELADLDVVNKDLAQRIKQLAINNPILNSQFPTDADDADWNKFADGVHIINSTSAEDVLDKTKEVLAKAKNLVNDQAIVEIN